ncbi:flagellar biosynthetic protein FlhF [Denitrovibrio acetiphilus DSM 12809]|uniref:Flagellar biosynthesis protein FlhF n=1 Tax=Denitrovibrio acetiphilus (strain DSM 12809 / NBRC 114555 / N2460) TaxID=522772 RepID=D4H6C1_DENA2|nr:flagellar biosynthesis protein FlhF [Denitrovibrio acetiphilus]ADD69595.1 flagellar biosynthetic protein FlhF [Denitrovibrio acetiphilus DSM 12809]
MRIKKYEVFDMKEAMKLIKEELGPDAMILSSRKVVKNNSLGLFSRPIIEVTAAVEDDDRVKKGKKSVGVNYDPAKEGNNKEQSGDLDRIAELINTLGLNRFDCLINDITEIKKQMMEMKSSLKENIMVDLTGHIREFYNLMVKNGVDEIIAYKFLKKIEKRASHGLTPNQIRNLVTQLMSELIPVEKDYFSSINKKVLALVGPTGVGKTTTIAKIAANLSLKMNKSVALITVDNFRIGAVEQLRTYAEIVDIPLRVASTPTELERIIYECRDYDYVFVDSMGRSQFDDSQIGDLLKFMEVSPLVKVALVMSMSSNHQEMADTYDRYSKLLPEYLIFTKLDETKYFGPLVNLPIKKKTPLMLLAGGQNVPDDMEVPDGKKIAGKILKEIPALWSDK